MDLQSYRVFGLSGLVVSPLALGTMTFGKDRWGADEAESRAIFNHYVEQGGNFIDTANVYSGGRSETLVGQFVAERAIRDRLVIATKSGFADASHPHAGGNGAKAIHNGVEGSLRRLRTDYIDLYWMHIWDMLTPAEEVLETFAALVRQGKIRYYALSNVPAWYAAKICTLARARAVPAPVGLQLEYSLVERAIEAEHIPMARDMGLAVQPWSPLAGGFLSGKYTAPSNGGEAYRMTEPDGDARLTGDNPFGNSKFTAKNWQILDVLSTVAAQSGRSHAQVALAWLLRRPLVHGMLIGVRSVAQLTESMAALDVPVTAEQLSTLDDSTQRPLSYPASIFTPYVRRLAFGGADVTPW